MPRYMAIALVLTLVGLANDGNTNKCQH
jgi:hypothetical protein